MKERSLSQEGLKLIACITMLIDHIGAIFLPGMDSLRILGRIAFPIYCFLLVEGSHYTRSSAGYAKRLAVGVLLSEIPFDLAFDGRIDLTSCSVMVTLLLGYGAIYVMGHIEGIWKWIGVLPFFLLAELLGSDYGGHGIMIIAWLAFVREQEQSIFLQFAGLAILLCYGYEVSVGFLQIPIELFGLFCLIPIYFYRGEKRTNSKWVKWAFYLFYPVHLLVLWGIRTAAIFL